MTQDVDLIIPMVFPQDPVWQAEYQKYRGGKDATQHVRFRSWGTEELLVRCCMKYMPWLRCIHILIAGESQVQGWMKEAAVVQQHTQPKVHIVFHKDFIPEDYLPCFSSPCFEMFLHKIPGLSECFIYGNDDMFPLSPLEPEDFFRPAASGTGALRPCVRFSEKAYPNNPNVFKRKCMAQLNMIGKPFGKHYNSTYLKPSHSLAPIMKSVCEEVWRRHGDEITMHLSPLTRTDRSYNHYIYMLQAYFDGQAAEHLPRERYVGPKTPTARIAKIIAEPDAGIVCLNDNDGIKDWEKRAAVVREAIRGKLGILAEETAVTAGYGRLRQVTAGHGIALCAIGRRENRYAQEFVEHYLGLGIDHIFICDNNHDGEERFEDVLGNRIAKHTVSIHDYRNRDTVQMTAYSDIYRKYGGQYDWICFFDFDELLVLNDSMTLKKWLSSFSDDTDTVLVNWMCMTDSGMILDDGRQLMERFNEAMPYDRCVQYDFPDNNHVKCIVRGGIQNVVFRKNPHIPDTAQHCRTADGVVCKPSPFQPYSFKTAYLKHFVTKTIEEWMQNKWQKGAGAIRYDKFVERYRDRFFKYNERTPEKQAYMEAFERNRAARVTVCIVHYNTPRLTQCAIRSLWKHTPGVGVIVFDNSDREPFPKMDGVEIIDNTRGQIIDFDMWLAQFPDKLPTKNRWASAKHCYTVQWLINKRRNPFVLMDSDVLVRQDISSFWQREQAFVGQIKPHSSIYRVTVDRVLPMLCFVNVPMIKRSGISFFHPQKMYALTSLRPDCAYDTGCWFLEDVKRHRLPYTDVDIDTYVLHLGHGSWKEKDAEQWLEENRELYCP